jgi:hypothetical protein
MQTDNKTLSANNVPYDTIKLLSAGVDGCVHEHMIDVSNI